MLVFFFIFLLEHSISHHYCSYRSCVFDRCQLQMLFRYVEIAPKYRLSGLVRRVNKLVTGRQIRCLNSRLFFQSCWIHNRRQKNINSCFPPLHATVILQFRPISHCMPNHPSETEYPGGKRCNFSPITTLLVSFEGTSSSSSSSKNTSHPAAFGTKS